MNLTQITQFIKKALRRERPPEEHLQDGPHLEEGALPSELIIHSGMMRLKNLMKLSTQEVFPLKEKEV